jgi:hypothetical protein
MKRATQPKDRSATTFASFRGAAKQAQVKRDRLVTASKRRRHLGSRQRRLEEEMTSAALPGDNKGAVARQRRTGAALSDSPIVVIPKHRHADTMCQRTQASQLVRRHGIWARVG